MRPLVYNFIHWPHYLDLSKDIEARLVNVCRFMRVTPEPTEREAFPSAYTQVRSPLVAFHKAHLASRLRERLAVAHARILLGGKLSDFSGVMPGIFEEALYTLR